MSPRRPRFLILSLLLFALGAFEAPRWKYRSSIAIPENAELVSARIPREVYLRSRPGLADLRVVREGEEIPYFIEALGGWTHESRQEAALLDKEALAAGLRLTLDLGSIARHSRVALETKEKNFSERVRVESSSDNRAWALVRDDAWIFNFAQDGREVTQVTVDYPVSTRRYIRLTIPGWRKPGAVTGARVILRESRPTEREVVAALAPQVIPEPATKSTAYLSDFGSATLPHDRLSIKTGPELFHRAVEVESSKDGKVWGWLATGAIYRIPQAESLTIDFAETHDRFLKLRIFNQDNHPVPVNRVDVESVIRKVHFKARQAGQYFLYFGNERAEKPSYDLAATLRGADLGAAIATVAIPEPNPVHEPYPEALKPWTERHPSLLYGILGAAILGMGAVTVRFLRKVSAKVN